MTQAAGRAHPGDARADARETQNRGGGSDRLFRAGVDAAAAAPSAAGEAVSAAAFGETTEARRIWPISFRCFRGTAVIRLQPLSWAALKEQGVELLFLATPHEASRSLVPEAMAQGLRVIDLSGAWRLKQEQHRAVYGLSGRGCGGGGGIDRESGLRTAGIEWRSHCACRRWWRIRDAMRHR